MSSHGRLALVDRQALEAFGRTVLQLHVRSHEEFLGHRSLLLARRLLLRQPSAELDHSSTWSSPAPLHALRSSTRSRRSRPRCPREWRKTVCEETSAARHLPNSSPGVAALRLLCCPSVPPTRRVRSPRSPRLLPATVLQTLLFPSTSSSSSPGHVLALVALAHPLCTALTEVALGQQRDDGAALDSSTGSFSPDLLLRPQFASAPRAVVTPEVFSVEGVEAVSTVIFFQDSERELLDSQVFSEALRLLLEALELIVLPSSQSGGEEQRSASTLT